MTSGTRRTRSARMASFMVALNTGTPVTYTVVPAGNISWAMLFTFMKPATVSGLPASSEDILSETRTCVAVKSSDTRALRYRSQDRSRFFNSAISAALPENESGTRGSTVIESPSPAMKSDVMIDVTESTISISDTRSPYARTPARKSASSTVPYFRSSPTRIITWLPKVSSIYFEVSRSGLFSGTNRKLLLSSSARGSCSAKNNVTAARTATIKSGHLKNFSMIQTPRSAFRKAQASNGRSRPRQFREGLSRTYFSSRKESASSRAVRAGGARRCR